jgi:dienelactone hydrolase
VACSKTFTLAAVIVAASFSVPGRSAQTPSTEDLKPGRIIERVVCKNNSDQTYALYLPSNYSSARSWPLIAAFDPGARGNLPVEHFKEAAERYGFIVCGSNTSRNGPMAPTGEAAKAMLGDVAARFAIDDKRVYLTGFSGGARAATALAVWLSAQVAGVIGCGAGLAEGLAPSSSLPFVYYGTVGNEDFNYFEMKKLDRALESASVTHHVEVFDGSHSWPPADVCVRAVEWIELQAMKSDRRVRDDSFIDRVLKSAQDATSTNESAGRVYDAYLGYAEIAADFKGLRDVAEIEKKAALLKESKPVKQAISKEREQETEQRRRTSELFGLRAKLTPQTSKTALGGGANAQPYDPVANSDSRQQTVSDLKGRLADLKRRSEAKESTPERALARRVLNDFTIGSFEQSVTLIQNKRYDLAAANLATDAEVMPDNWRVLYNLACAYALGGDKRRAIEALNNAVRKGFSNSSELESNHQLDSIRNESGFKKIVEGLEKNQ